MIFWLKLNFNSTRNIFFRHRQEQIPRLSFTLDHKMCNTANNKADLSGNDHNHTKETIFKKGGAETVTTRVKQYQNCVTNTMKNNASMLCTERNSSPSMVRSNAPKMLSYPRLSAVVVLVVLLSMLNCSCSYPSNAFKIEGGNNNNNFDRNMNNLPLPNITSNLPEAKWNEMQEILQNSHSHLRLKRDAYARVDNDGNIVNLPDIK